jgi:tetratricopeptide (TPR) repeat protein
MKNKKILILIFCSLILVLFNYDLKSQSKNNRKESKLIRKGNTFFNKSDFHKAVTFYSKALNVNPKNAETYFNRGRARIDLKTYSEALKDFDSTLKYNVMYAAAYNNRALCKSNLDDNLGAINDYTKAIEISPTVPLYYLNRGICYEEDFAEHEKAIVDYNKVLELDSLNFEAYNNRGNSRLKLKNYTDAILDLSKAIQLKPDFGLAYNNRGYCKSMLGDYEEAIKDLDFAEKIYPTYIFIYSNRGNIFLKLNRITDACSNWKRAIELGYIYNPQWKTTYDIDNPVDLIKIYCK